MADHSSIEWTEATWNVATGCTRVSEGCDHCYIERTVPFRVQGRRFDKPGVGGTTGVKVHSERLHLPLRWRKPRRVFVNSLADLFHDDIPDRFIAETYAVMALAKQHTFQLLTKRPARMRSLLAGARTNGFWDDLAAALFARGYSGAIEWPLPNVWAGVSVESQKWADIRIPALLGTPAAVRWLSCEPLLGPVDLTRLAANSRQQPEMVYDAVGQRYGVPGRWQASTSARIDWVVVGGESGPGARPMHPDWARSLRDQCTATGVPFFFKQWGEWAPWATYFAADKDEHGRWDAYVNPDGTTGEYAISEDHDLATNWTGDPAPGNKAMSRVGKKGAGRDLDGRTWDEYPTPRVAEAVG